MTLRTAAVILCPPLCSESINYAGPVSHGNHKFGGVTIQV